MLAQNLTLSPHQSQVPGIGEHPSIPSSLEPIQIDRNHRRIPSVHRTTFCRTLKQFGVEGLEELFVLVVIDKRSNHSSVGLGDIGIYNFIVSCLLLGSKHPSILVVSVNGQTLYFTYYHREILQNNNSGMQMYGEHNMSCIPRVVHILCQPLQRSVPAGCAPWLPPHALPPSRV